MFFKWVSTPDLATSGMLTEDLLDDVARIFKTVVILAEDEELEYDPSDLESRGVKIVREPIEDFSAPPLIRLHFIVEGLVEAPKPVLVHCSGGRGRSGTVAVAYLIATRGMSSAEALIAARRVEPGYVETPEQERVLRLYSRVLKVCGYRLFSKAVHLGVKYGFGRGLVHASSVLEHSTELVEELESIGVKLPLFWERALYVSAVLHDIGAVHGDKGHREHSYRMILEHAELLNSATGEDIANPVALLARYHGAKDPTPRELAHEGLLALGVLRIADGLDYTARGTVLGVRVVRTNGSITLYVEPVSPSLSERLKAKVEEKARLLEEVLGVEVNVVVE